MVFLFKFPGAALYLIKLCLLLLLERDMYTFKDKKNYKISCGSPFYGYFVLRKRGVLAVRRNINGF